MPQHRPEQLVQPGVGQVRLREQARRREDEHATIAREPGRLGDERRLADAGLPHDKESRPAFVQRPERLVKAPQLGDAACQRRRIHGDSSSRT